MVCKNMEIFIRNSVSWNSPEIFLSSFKNSWLNQKSIAEAHGQLKTEGLGQKPA